MPGYVEEELRGYLQCGFLCFGFARARCTGCGQGFVVAFSCKGRGGDIRLIADGRQEPAHFEPEVRKRVKARMASPA